MSIEKHYNELRSQALRLERIADGKEVTRDSVERLIYIANRRSARAWPNDRARYAEAHAEMPSGPVVYGKTGVTVEYNPVGVPNICANRSTGNYDTDVMPAAREEMRSEYAELAREAREAFDRYALAVAQGVAIDPDQEASND